MPFLDLAHAADAQGGDGDQQYEQEAEAQSETGAESEILDLVHGEFSGQLLRWKSMNGLARLFGTLVRAVNRSALGRLTRCPVWPVS